MEMKKYPIRIYSNVNQNNIQVLAFIIDQCDMHCFYCYNKMPRTMKKINLEKLYLFLIELNNQTEKNINLDIIGGEPTLHDDLFDFCIKTRKLSFLKINIYTNFNRDISYFESLISSNLELSITYHYQNDIESFKQKLFQLISNKNASINLTIMYEPSKYIQSIQFFKEIKLLNHPRIKTIELALILSDTANKKELKYSKEQIDAYDEICKDESPVKGEFIVEYNDKTKEELSFYQLQNNQNLITQFWKCYAGIEYLDIDIDGNVYTCSASKNKIFNINDNLLAFKAPTKPIICKTKYCQCRWDITKEKIFK